MIKVIISDGDGTLELPSPSNEMLELLGTLQDLGIELAVASNGSESTVRKNFQAAGLPKPSCVVTPKIVTPMGAKRIVKPSPVFVNKIMEMTGAQPHEIVYLGDDDRTDIFCAINAKVLPITATYSKANKPRNYGIPMGSPQKVLKFLSTFGKQESPYFGWYCSSTCPDTDLPIDVKALIGNHTGFTDRLETVLKEGSNKVAMSPKKRKQIVALLFFYLVSQCYLSGAIANIDWVCAYPGHKESSSNALLGEYLKWFSKLFREKFQDDLIVRHMTAPKSQYAGPQRNIFSQFRTIKINSDYKRKLKGKSVLVLDDFTTRGYSLETARRMLLQAGAKQVMCLAIAKFGSTHSVTRISTDWNPFEPCTLKENEIDVSDISRPMNKEADDYFKKRIWKSYLG